MIHSHPFSGFGGIPDEIFQKVLVISGVVWDDKRGQYRIGMQDVTKDKIDERTKRPAGHETIHTMAKFYNFMYALMMDDGDFAKACDRAYGWISIKDEVEYLPEVFKKKSYSEMMDEVKAFCYKKADENKAKRMEKRKEALKA